MKLKDLDLFSAPVGVTYSRYSTFRSSYGGILSVVFLVLSLFLIVITAYSKTNSTRILHSDGNITLNSDIVVSFTRVEGINEEIVDGEGFRLEALYVDNNIGKALDFSPCINKEKFYCLDRKDFSLREGSYLRFNAFICDEKHPLSRQFCLGNLNQNTYKLRIHYGNSNGLALLHESTLNYNAEKTFDLSLGQRLIDEGLYNSLVHRDAFTELISQDMNPSDRGFTTIRLRKSMSGMVHETKLFQFDEFLAEVGGLIYILASLFLLVGRYINDYLYKANLMYKLFDLRVNHKPPNSRSSKLDIIVENSEQQESENEKDNIEAPVMTKSNSFDNIKLTSSDIKNNILRKLDKDDILSESESNPKLSSSVDYSKSNPIKSSLSKPGPNLKYSFNTALYIRNSSSCKIQDDGYFKPLKVPPNRSRKIHKMSFIEMVCAWTSKSKIGNKLHLIGCFEKFKEEIDILKLFRRSNEIEMLKYLLLDKHQLNLFNAIRNKKRTLYANSNEGQFVELSDSLVSEDFVKAPSTLCSLNVLGTRNEGMTMKLVRMYKGASRAALEA